MVGKYKIDDEVYIYYNGKIIKANISGFKYNSENILLYYLKYANGAVSTENYLEKNLFQTKDEIEKILLEINKDFKFNIGDLIYFDLSYVPYDSDKSIGIITEKIIKDLNNNNNKIYSINYISESSCSEISKKEIFEDDIIFVVDKSKLNYFQNLNKKLEKYSKLKKEIGCLSFDIDKDINKIFNEIDKLPIKKRWYHRKSKYHELIKFKRK